jgi:hypothetical protein
VVDTVTGRAISPNWRARRNVAIISAPEILFVLYFYDEQTNSILSRAKTEVDDVNAYLCERPRKGGRG